MISDNLRRWFVVHCIADVVFAIPLLVIPVEFLNLFGWQTIDPLTTRLVAAALFGIASNRIWDGMSGLKPIKAC